MWQMQFLMELMLLCFQGNGLGEIPYQAVKTMVKITKTTEESLEYKEIIQKFVERRISVTNAISQATCRTADVLGVSAIFTATSSGHTARMVSKFRPSAQIIAFTLIIK